MRRLTAAAVVAAGLIVPATAGAQQAPKSDEELVWEGLRPELVCEVEFDHITGHRIGHGAKFARWRTDKEPDECVLSQLRS